MSANVRPEKHEGYRKPGTWAPGQSGNPKGRPPKERALTPTLERKLDPELLADKLIELINAGDLAAIKYAYDRIEGSPTQRREDITPERLRAEAERLAQELGVEGGAEAVIEQYRRLTVIK